MSDREALKQVIELLVAAAQAAHQAGLTQLYLAIQSVLYDAQRAYKRRSQAKEVT